MQRSPTCGNCLKNYEFKDVRPVGPRIPLLLSCGHSFCEGCLLKLSKNNQEIKCPTCEAVTLLAPEGEKGVKNLLPDIYLLGVLTYNKRAAIENGNSANCVNGPCWNFGNIHHLAAVKPAKELNNESKIEAREEKEASADSHTLCEGCSEKATCICKSCDDCTFCKSCFIKHHKDLKKLQKHSPLPLSFPRKIDLECSVHNGRILEFFDNNADEPICALCIIEEQRKGHGIVPIGQLDQELKERLEDSLSAANEIRSLLKVSEKVIACAVPELTFTANQFVQDVKNFFNKMHASLQIREAAILSEATDAFANSFNLTSQISDCIQKQKSIEAVLKEYNAVSQQPQTLRIKVKEILAKLEEFKNVECFAKSIDKNEDRLRFVAEEDKASWLKDIGELEIKSGKLFEMLRLRDVPEETRNLIKGKQPNVAAVSIQSLEENEILGESSSQSGTIERLSHNRITMSSSFELVYVTFVKTPENFYIQRCSDKDRLQHMMYGLNKYCKKSDRPEDLVFCPEKDDLVCAQFLADNNWYRAKIISTRSIQQPDIVPTLENGLPIEVHYIDYGNTESLPLARLRKMQAKFLQVPELAVPCSLVDIVPPNRQESWPLNSTKAFNSFVGEEPLLMNIRFRFDGRLYVDLKRPDENDEPTRDDERPVSVRDALVFLEVARFTSPESAPVATCTRVFKEPALLKPDEQTDVVITHVVSPHEIYVQKFDSLVNEIQEELAKLYSGKKRNETANIGFPYRNMICAARYSEDKMWYRGLVTHVYDDCKVDVKFVDYGNSEKTSVNELRKLPDACMNLRKQALPVKLKDVTFLDDTDEWTPEAIDFLKKTILDRPMVLIPKVIEDNIMSAELCDTSTDEDIYINYLLVNKGFAVSTGQSSTQAPYGISAPSVDPGSMIGDSETVSNNLGDDRSETASCSGRSDVSAALPVYRSPGMPQKSAFAVMGTFVDDDGTICGHLIGEDAEFLSMISQVLNNGDIANSPSVQNARELQQNQACVAQFSADELWYRASVIKIDDSENVEVEFIDFGNREMVHVRNLRPLSPFLDVPKQAIRMRLHGIESVEKDGNYPPEALEPLNAVLVNQSFSVQLKGPQTDPDALSVFIEVDDNTNLGESLVAAGFAKKINPLARNDVIKDELPQIEQLSMREYFTDPTLPDIGVHFDVHVTQVERPNMIYIQRLLQNEDDKDGPYALDDDETRHIAMEENEQHGRISMLMNSEGFFDDSSYLDIIKPGMLCCAKYSVDDQWYRAIIKSVNTRSEGASNDIISADLLFVDYGTFETVPLNKIRKIPDSFIELPIQSICCELAGFYPPPCATGTLYRDTQWPIETMKKLYEIVHNKRLIACILDYGPPVQIILFDRIETKSGETGEKVDKAVAQILAEKNLGIFDLCKASTLPSKSKDDGLT